MVTLSKLLRKMVKLHELNVDSDEIREKAIEFAKYAGERENQIATVFIRSTGLVESM